MKTKKAKYQTYKLPGNLNQFQKEMYIHLINWKWNKLGIKDPGIYQYKDRLITYDVILPQSSHYKYPHIYPEIFDTFQAHQKMYPFRLHRHFYHMASSQVANLNLFLPVLLSSKANEVFQQLKPDFKQLDTKELYKGFRIEFWDGQGNEKGVLGDHNARSGTDSDIAIAYRNLNNELCLWLIEHKLTESEFTTCGGAKSRNWNTNKHDCSNSLTALINTKHKCYYHDVRQFNYWNITEKHLDFFAKYQNYNVCPFLGGMNQLWRNQLLALALEDTGRYKHVYFSVVHHPENLALNSSIKKYKDLINNNLKFSVFTSNKVVEIAGTFNDASINKWVVWYKDFYKIGEVHN